MDHPIFVKLQAQEHANDNPGHRTKADDLGWGCDSCDPWRYDEIAESGFEVYDSQTEGED